MQLLSPCVTPCARTVHSMLSGLRLACRIHVQTLRNGKFLSMGRLQLPHQLQHACKLLRAAPLAKPGSAMRRPLSVSGAGQLHNLLHRYECDVALLQIEPQWHALAVYRQIASFVSCGSQRRRDMHMCAAPAGRQPDLQPCKGPSSSACNPAKCARCTTSQRRELHVQTAGWTATPAYTTCCWQPDHPGGA